MISNNSGRHRKGFRLSAIGLTITGLAMLVAASFNPASAQLDTKHYVPPFFSKSMNDSDVDKHWAVLSTPSEDTIPVVIKDGTGFVIDTVDIAQDFSQAYLIEDGSGSDFPLNVIPEDSLNMPTTTQGLIFESFQPFFVNIRHKAGSQGTSFTSKGQVALGQKFYSGHVFGELNETGSADDWNNNRRTHYISVMATEDATTITFDKIKDYVQFIGTDVSGDPPASDDITVTIDQHESYTIGVDYSLLVDSNCNNAIGTRILSDKPIAVNTGSWLAGQDEGQCIGSDQIVPFENVGQEYVVIKGLGDETTEHPVVVATEDDTDVFINGESTPFATLDEGEFAAIPTENFSDNNNMYIVATANIYVYQTISGSSTNIGPTVGMNFIPPLQCIGAKVVNIPFVNQIGTGQINIVTKTGSSIYVNGSTDPLTGAQPVPGITDWVSYELPAGNGDFFVESDSVMNVALLTRDNNVGTAGYFSGFTIEPVVGLSAGISGSNPCIPGNALLQSYGFDSYQWYFDGEPVEGATSNTFFPQFPGVYTVSGIDEACGFEFPSNPFVIPLCDSDLGVAKEDVNVEETEEDSYIYDVTYRVNVVNYGISEATNIQVLEDIEAGLADGATVSIQEPPSIVFGVLGGSVNPDFDGIDDQRLLDGTGDLPLGASDAIEFTLRIDMSEATEDGYENQVTITAGAEEDGPNDGETGPFTGQDFSHTGLNPDPDNDDDPTNNNESTFTCFFENTISYPELVYCQSDENPVAAIDGIDIGEFSADEGLSIDAATGEIDLMASTAGGPYTITYTVGDDCPTEETTQIEIIPVPDAGEDAQESVCAGSEVVLFDDVIGGDPDEDGTWFDSDQNEVDPPELDPEEPGSYEFTYRVTSSPCDPDVATVTINVDEQPYAGELGTEEVCDTIPEFDLLNLVDEMGDENGTWGGPDTVEINDLMVNPTEIGEGNIEFYYAVEGVGACEAETDTTFGTLVINLCLPDTTTPPDPEEFMIPEGFSPNGDGIGDAWVITRLNELYPNNSVVIYNRWGTEVFSARPYQNDWRGEANTGANIGDELPVGTYFYVLDLGEGIDPETGYVYLNR